MFRFSKISRRYKPKKFFESSDKKLYTLKCQDFYGALIHKKELYLYTARLAHTNLNLNLASLSMHKEKIINIERSFIKSSNDPFFKQILVETIPCVIIAKCKSNWCLGIDTLVQFMTGNLDDVFLIHPTCLPIRQLHQPCFVK